MAVLRIHPFILLGLLLHAVLGVLASAVAVVPHQRRDEDISFLPELLSPRQEHSVAIVDNGVYVIGGITSNYSYTPDTITQPSIPRTVDLVQVYDLATARWSDAAALPFSINHANVASVDGKIYLLGGLLGANLTLWGAVPDSFVYDPAENKWADATPMSGQTARGAAAVGVRGSEIYLAGGMRSLEIGPPGLQTSVALVSSYNTQTDIWNTNYPPLPEARDHVGGAVIGDKFYVVGGRDHGQYNVRGTVWALDLNDPQDKGWESLASMPTPRGGLAATSAGHCIYTFGGEGNNETSSGAFDNVEVYDTRTDTWTVEKPLWAGIHGTQAVTHNDGVILIPGGGYKLGAGPSTFFAAYPVNVSRCF